MEERRKKVWAAIAEFGAGRVTPSPRLHARRNQFNIVPAGNLIATGEVKVTGKSRRAFPVYRDLVTGDEWVLQPWYLTMFHQPRRNYKFLAYDTDIVAGARGSSEIIIPKNAKIHGQLIETFDSSRMKRGSYNFRTHGPLHFFADILPVALYCNRVGV